MGKVHEGSKNVNEAEITGDKDLSQTPRSLKISIWLLKTAELMGSRLVAFVVDLIGRRFGKLDLQGF